MLSASPLYPAALAELLADMPLNRQAAKRA
jgi:hypothetical protein